MTMEKTAEDCAARWRQANPDRVIRVMVEMEYESCFAIIVLHHEKTEKAERPAPIRTPAGGKRKLPTAKPVLPKVPSFGKCGDGLTWRKDGDVLCIKGQGEMKEDAFLEDASIRKVVIAPGCTGIGKRAFQGCTGLTDVIIPDSVTQIDEYAFYNCTGLTGITIPDNVTWIGDAAFSYCLGLTGITLPDGVTRIGRETFDVCPGLTSIMIPEGVTEIGRFAFRGCSGLTGITIPDSVTRIDEGAFSCCSGLTSITIPDGVTGIGWGAFQNVPHIIYHGPAQSEDNWGAKSRN